MKQQQTSTCPCGCAPYRPVCLKGKRLYHHAVRVFRCLPDSMPLRPTRQEQYLLELWDAVSEAWLAHIGQATNDRME